MTTQAAPKMNARIHTQYTYALPTNKDVYVSTDTVTWLCNRFYLNIIVLRALCLDKFSCHTLAVAAPRRAQQKSVLEYS